MGDIVLTTASGRPTLADVLPDCVAALSGVENGLNLPRVDHVVVVLVDGLGAAQLRARVGHARRMTRGWAKRDTAFTFPSTTVSGITTLTTGERAGCHGMLAYSVYDRGAGIVRNQLSGWGPGMEPASWQPRPTVFERVRDGDARIRCSVVGSAEYEYSGLTQASLRGAEYVPADGIDVKFARTLDVLAQGGPSLTYTYVAELDQTGHAVGWESGDWLARLEELDSAVGRFLDRLPPRTGVLITADHGMLDIPVERQIEIDLDGPLGEGVDVVAGEPRLRHLYLADRFADENARRAHAELLVRRWREAEGNRATILTGENAIAAGWYGEWVSEAARSRIGDVIVAATKLVTYYPAGASGPGRGVIGQHGSISAEETIVPLIRHGAFARE